jgi:hypothetical protein
VLTDLLSARLLAAGGGQKAAKAVQAPLRRLAASRG